MSNFLGRKQRLVRTLSTGPDLRYGVRLEDNSVILGSRSKVLADALLAWSRGLAATNWKAPGSSSLAIQQRVISLIEDYDAGVMKLMEQPDTEE